MSDSNQDVVNTENANIKNAKRNRFHRLYYDMLPNAELYEKSYMHKNAVTHIAIGKNDFIITASVDGVVKFWKKLPVGIENVKHFKAHLRKSNYLFVITTD